VLWLRRLSIKLNLRKTIDSIRNFELYEDSIILERKIYLFCSVDEIMPKCYNHSIEKASGKSQFMVIQPFFQTTKLE